jgi:cytoskeleton protein RodZ
LRGVSLREIADATKISVRFLEALEADRVEVLPGGVFRRSFVRQYARHLGLDAERLVAEFVFAHGEAGEEGAAPARVRGGSHPGGVFLVGLFAALAVLALLKARPSQETRTPPFAVPPPATIPVIESPAPPAPAAAFSVAEARGLTLTLEAQASCWVEARVDGQVVLNRVLAEGQSETVEAAGEIVLSVGNAGGLRVTVGDRPGVVLGKSGEVRRNIVITKQSLPSLLEEASSVRASHSS